MRRRCCTLTLSLPLTLQVTASAAALLHRREDAQVAMRLALFPILEHLGDETTLLSSAAELTLCRLCRGAAHEPNPNLAPNPTQELAERLLGRVAALQPSRALELD